MKAIKELIHLINRYKRRQIEILGKNEDPTSLYEVFYDQVAKGNFQTDDQAAEYLFGRGKDGKFKEYQNLKANLKRRLINSLFFIDLKQPEFNDPQAAFHNCWKNLAAVKMLQARANHHAASDLAKKTLEAALKYELTEVVLALARVLRYHYFVLEWDRRKWDYYNRLVDESIGALAAISKAETMHQTLTMPYIKSRSHKPETTELAKEFLKELEPLVKRYPIHQLFLHYYMIARIERETAHDYQGMAAVCREAIQFFQDRPATQNTTIAFFYHSLCVASTMLGAFYEAENAIKHAEHLLEEGTFNWFKSKEYHLVLKLYQKDYPGAYPIFKKAFYHAKYETLPDIEQESWKIYEALMALLAQTGNIVPEKKYSLKPEKFLNEVPEYSKDKRGMNVTILILHTLFLLHQQRHEEAGDRLLALGKYADRHLKAGDDTFRSYCFIKALTQIPKAGFERKASEAAAAGWLRQMSSVPVMLSNQPHEVESIPYEHLWEIAMKALERGGGGGQDIDDETLEINEVGLKFNGS